MNLGRSAVRQAIRLVATVLPTFVLPIGAVAQTNTGMIEGFARVAGTDAPMPFSLVRLLRGDTLRTRSQETIQQTITNADGRFRFASVQAGELRLQILRIGFHPMVSPVLRLGSGQDLRYDLLSEPLPVQLPVVAVHGTSGQDQLAIVQELAARGKTMPVKLGKAIGCLAPGRHRPGGIHPFELDR